MTWDHSTDWYGMHGHATPLPDAIVRYADGSFVPMMFHFASEGCNPRDIAREHGFDLQWVDMESVVPDDDSLFIDYFEHGADDVVRRWTPPEIDGWRLVGKNDTEDGPVACYIRPATPQTDGGADHG